MRVEIHWTQVSVFFSLLISNSFVVPHEVTSRLQTQKSG